MDYNRLIESIVEEILDEVTFLRARRSGLITPEQIKGARKLRDEASRRFGQKVPVMSGHRSDYHGSDITSGALGPLLIAHNKRQASIEGAASSIRAQKPLSSSERVRAQLFFDKPHIRIKVADSGNNSDFIPAVGHELGHVIDPVQSDPGHYALDQKGRREYNNGVYDYVENSPKTRAVIKSEGRAWRIGRDLQKTVGLEPDDVWKERAKRSLSSYTEPTGVNYKVPNNPDY